MVGVWYWNTFELLVLRFFVTTTRRRSDRMFFTTKIYGYVISFLLNGELIENFIVEVKVAAICTRRSINLAVITKYSRFVGSCEKPLDRSKLKRKKCLSDYRNLWVTFFFVGSEELIGLKYLVLFPHFFVDFLFSRRVFYKFDMTKYFRYFRKSVFFFNKIFSNNFYPYIVV